MKATKMLVMMALGSSLGAGAAMQQTGGPVTSMSAIDDMSLAPRHNGSDDSPFHGTMMAQRMRAANLERQRTLTREATELLHVAGELQLKAQKNETEVSREEMLREVDAIEKLAHNVKERMKEGR